MKTLIVYYSRTGETKKAAVEISKLLDAEIEELVDAKNRAGIVGYLLAGRDAFLKKSTVLKQTTRDPSLYELVVVGTPVWVWNMSPAVRTYLIQNRVKFRKAAFYCTMGGSGGGRVLRAMEVLCGMKPVSMLELSEKDEISGQKTVKIGNFVRSLQVKV